MSDCNCDYTNNSLVSLRIDDRITFIEGIDSSFEVVRRNNMSPSEVRNLTQNFNVVDSNGTMLINFFVGLNSSYSENNLLNSNFYDIDETLQTNILPFNDSEDYLGRKISYSFNPKKLPITYGQNIFSELFNENDDLPFEDIEPIENVSQYFEDPRNISYARYFDDYAVSSLNSNISIFDTIDTISGRNIYGKSIKGIKAEIIKNSTDARDRQILIINKLTNNDLIANQDNEIESFLDEEIESANERTVSTTKNFQFKTELFNNRTIKTFNTLESSLTTIRSTSNNLNYFSEDDSKIIPFDDTRTSYKIDSDYNDDENYSIQGFIKDNQNGTLPDSFAFIGEAD